MNWICLVCNKEFFRYRSQVRNPDKIFCSVSCKGRWQKTNFAGTSNPNFKTGTYFLPSVCSCGLEKDYRANNCSECAGKSFSIGEKGLFDEQKILLVLQETTSFLEAAEKLNLTRSTLTKYVKERNINISHFRPGRNRPIPDENLFSIGNTIRHGIVKNRILKHNLKENQCEICKQNPYWNNEPLLLEIDHINGNPRDNRLENLRLLCPNCHSQTATYCGRNGKKYVNNKK